MSWKEDLRASDLTAETFTEIMAKAVRERLDASAEVAAPLALRVSARGTSARESIAFQCNLRGLWERGIEDRDFERRHRHCEEYLQGLQEQIEQPGESERPAGEPAPSALRPILQSRDFVQQANRQYENAGVEAHLCADPLAANLRVVYVLDRPRSISFLSSQNLGLLDMTEEEMAERAHRNLREEFEEAELDVLTLENEGITTYKLSAEDIFASSLPLIPEVPRQFAARVEENLLAVVPARDELFFAGTEHPLDVRMLRMMGEKLFEEERHPVSRSLIAWLGGQWEAYEEA
jgi:hypothetical protein